MDIDVGMERNNKVNVLTYPLENMVFWAFKPIHDVNMAKTQTHLRSLLPHWMQHSVHMFNCWPFRRNHGKSAEHTEYTSRMQGDEHRTRADILAEGRQQRSDDSHRTADISQGPSTTGSSPPLVFQTVRNGERFLSWFFRIDYSINDCFKCGIFQTGDEHEDVGVKLPSDELVIHCHGGGFIAQSSRSHETYLRQWATEIDAPIFSIDYSLAPECPYPRALEDAFYGYCWALQNLGKLGTTGKRIVLAGKLWKFESRFAPVEFPPDVFAWNIKNGD